MRLAPIKSRGAAGQWHSRHHAIRGNARRDDLPKIMSVYWEQVEPFFSHGKDDWLERLAFVGEVRVNLAHHRHADLSAQDLGRLRFTCREILKWLADRQA